MIEDTILCCKHQNTYLKSFIYISDGKDIYNICLKSIKINFLIANVCMFIVTSILDRRNVTQKRFTLCLSADFEILL